MITYRSQTRVIFLRVGSTSGIRAQNHAWSSARTILGDCTQVGTKYGLPGPSLRSDDPRSKTELYAQEVDRLRKPALPKKFNLRKDVLVVRSGSKLRPREGPRPAASETGS
jgi:hypothetical protein